MGLQDCFDLPPDYFQQLPSDLRLDVSSICVLFLVGFPFKATFVMYLVSCSSCYRLSHMSIERIYVCAIFVFVVK
jgi:hypothetical protein